MARKLPSSYVNAERLYLYQSHLRIVKRHTAPHLVNHAGVLQMWVDPHDGIGVDSPGTARIALDDLAVDGDILGAA